MGKLEQLIVGALVTGLDPAGASTVVSTTWSGTQALTLVYRDAKGELQERLLFRGDEGSFDILEAATRPWSFDADGYDFRLAVEARRIQLAHLFDPYVALSSSEVEPLPHQIEAVYGEMLPRQPLRFLLADDPGAGKTIMAGLYIKELIIRGDAERVLIVAPGSLVSQWRDELSDKFGMEFEVLTKADLDGADVTNPLVTKDRLIARVDQLSRRDDLDALLEDADFDLVVVDEAHRMSAHFYGDEVKRTKRYQLGEKLGAATRHLLLMTATPHAGKEDDFQLFLALLDSDRFEGRVRDGVHSSDASDLMRRMVKEKLLTFEGKPLFPERKATTVQYDLSPEELVLYDEVTEYVREEMNRADRLKREGQGRRGNTVGFALTLLQRRLASSPEAIYQSLKRRRKRLESRVIEERQRARAAQLGLSPLEERLSTLLGTDFDEDDFDELAGDEQEALEVEVIDAATAAATVDELQIEIRILEQLEELARRLRASGADTKWVQLSGLLASDPDIVDERGSRRKLLIFTEHRDTLNYLVDRLRTFLGSKEAVVHISGGTPREERLATQARFTQDESCIVLVATDAAGEGINLQRAHLVINYDLPWNPNRIEQRFGRVHRIGQTEVCHMWNLVAKDTREAQVYLRLLDKIDQQRIAYKGQVFDVLGEAITGFELRSLLMDAIRYGEDPEVRDRINRVIDDEVEQRIRQAIDHPPLATETMAFSDVERIRAEMEEAQARKLQPFYVQAFFTTAFGRLGGRLAVREPGRFAIPTVPATVRRRDRQLGQRAPILPTYERVTFKKPLVRQQGAPIAELVAPGHPLLESTIDLTVERHRSALRQGTVLIDEAATGTDPYVLVLLEHSIVDARPSRVKPYTLVSRRFEFIAIPASGDPWSPGYAPHLDLRPPTESESDDARSFIDADWLGEDLEARGLDHAIRIAVPEHVARVRAHTEDRVDRTLSAVHQRLTREINYWDNRANTLQERADAGKTPRMNADRARQRAERIARRLDRRTVELRAERSLRPLPPEVIGGALVIPIGALTSSSADERAPIDVARRKEVEERGVEAVLRAEAELGWDAVDMNTVNQNNPGYDIRSTRKPGPHEPLQIKRIEVKARWEGGPDVSVTSNQVFTALNDPEHFVLALVEVRADGTDEVRYLRQPFTSVSEEFAHEMTKVSLRWDVYWPRAHSPLEDRPRP